MVVLVGGMVLGEIGHRSSCINKSETQYHATILGAYHRPCQLKNAQRKVLQMVIFLIFTWISKCSPMGTTTANLISAMQMLPVLLVLSVLAVLVSDLWSAMLAAKCPRL